MKYRVVFRERANSNGSAKSPVDYLQSGGSESVVRSSRLLVRKGPDWKASSDPGEEDEAYLKLGTEIWEYVVAEGKDQVFKDALLNSGSILEFAPVVTAEPE